MRCIGFDPGSKLIGFAVIEQDIGGRPKWIAHGKVGVMTNTIVDLIKLHRVDIVVVEKPAGFVYEHKRGAALIETSNVAGQLKVIAEMLMLPVSEMSASFTRSVVVGKANASDGHIKAVLRQIVVGMPKVTSVHARDGAVAAIAAIRIRGAERARGQVA